MSSKNTVFRISQIFFVAYLNYPAKNKKQEKCKHVLQFGLVLAKKTLKKYNTKFIVCVSFGPEIL